jgi:hypothetical protein
MWENVYTITVENAIEFLLSKRKTMPTIPGLIDTFDKLKFLHKKKNDDYAGDRGAFFNFEFSQWFASNFKRIEDMVYAVIIGIKFARLAVLLSRDDAPQNEPIEDTFDDVIVYTAIWKSAYMERTRARLSQTRIKEANTV